MLAASASLYAAKADVKVFIEPQSGFESYIAAAIVKKDTPVTVTTDRDAATYIITSSVKEKPESTGGKVARCLFAYCAGIEGSQTVSIQMINAKTKDVAFAYNVRKSGSSNYQSSAEAGFQHTPNEKPPRPASLFWGNPGQRFISFPRRVSLL